LRGGATRVIITSRRDEAWLGSCYQKIPLRGLNQRDAMELAVKVLNRAGIHRQKLKPYDKLLHYLQGNPLAIQVILPELAHSEPDALLAALQTGAAALAKDDRAQGREQSLTASLEYRLDRLDKLLRSRLGVLGLFQGFVNADVLAFICTDDSAPELLRGLDSEAWIRMLDLSAEIGLLRNAGHGLYNIHPALPWFFHQIVQTTYAEDMNWLEQRFATVCGDFSQALQQQLKTNAAAAMTFMRFEEQNFRYAIHLGCRYRMWDALNRIVSGMAEMLGRQSRWSEFELLNRDIKRDATDEQGAPLEGAEVLCASLWHNLGMIAQKRQEFDEAEHWYRKSLAINEMLKNEYGQASTLHQLGIVAEERQEFDEAEHWYRKSLALKEKLKDEYGQAQTLHQLGRIAAERRQFDEAERLYVRAEAIFENYRDEHNLSIVRSSLERLRRARA
jgi:tetratricopeptide (TPR) repeat protein